MTIKELNFIYLEMKKRDSSFKKDFDDLTPQNLLAIEIGHRQAKMDFEYKFKHGLIGRFN